MFSLRCQRVLDRLGVQDADREVLGRAHDPNAFFLHLMRQIILVVQSSDPEDAADALYWMNWSDELQVVINNPFAAIQKLSREDLESLQRGI